MKSNEQLYATIDPYNPDYTPVPKADYGFIDILANFGNFIGDRAVLMGRPALKLYRSYNYRPRHAAKLHEAESVIHKVGSELAISAQSLHHWIEEHPRVNLEAELPPLERLSRHLIDGISPELDPNGQEKSIAAAVSGVTHHALESLHIPLQRDKAHEEIVT